MKVYDAEIVTNFDREGAISFVGGRYEPNIDISTIPGLSPSAALSVLQQWIIELGQSPRFHADYLSKGLAPLTNELVVYVDPSGNSRLAYHVIQPTLTEG